MTSGIIFDIKRYAINDGPGIRTAIFFKGCPLECWWCHNPEGQSSQPQLIFRANRCIASKECIQVCPRGAIRWTGESTTDWENCDDCGDCAEVCPTGAREIIGQVYTVEQLMGEIKRDIPFFDQSGGGVTFTGGEPMFQRDFLYESLVACKKYGIQTVVDTSGYATWEAFELILPYVSLFLIDLKIMNDGKHKQYTNVSNRMILENLKRLSAAAKHVIVRLPIIPGVNDDEEDIFLSAEFLAALPNLDGVELMPYHEIGLAKYQALGLNYKLTAIQPNLRQQLDEIEKIMSQYQLPVRSNISGRIV